jgi:hypothetical protein
LWMLLRHAQEYLQPETVSVYLFIGRHSPFY